jgi:hypothetical protein
MGPKTINQLRREIISVYVTKTLPAASRYPEFSYYVKRYAALMNSIVQARHGTSCLLSLGLSVNGGNKA